MRAHEGERGHQRPTHDVVKVLQAALSLPIHLVRGYKGTAEIRLAAASGEVAGGCWPWESLRPTWRSALDSGEAGVVLQVTEKPLPDLPGVPLALDLARTDEARQLIWSGVIVPTIISRLYALPATPADRVRTLRAAFLKTLSDPEFVAEARQASFDIDPTAFAHAARRQESRVAQARSDIQDRLSGRAPTCSTNHSLTAEENSQRPSRLVSQPDAMASQTVRLRS